MKMKLRNSALLIILILLIDQWSKMYVKTNFILGEEVEVFRWFKLLFIENEGMAWGTCLIFAGAFGNIIDSVFYGIMFDDSHHQVASYFSNKPYGTWFHGKVVDMFYFPFIEDYMVPSWVPFMGGKQITFFNAIFNVADFAISTGVGILIFFNKKAFAHSN